MPAMSEAVVGRVREVESELAKLPQMELKTMHVLHGGMYSRTVIVPANHVIVGVLVKVPTQVIVSGSARVFAGDKVLNLAGFNVIPAQAGRKQIFVAITDIFVTMIFPSSAETVEQAESEFTDENEMLMSRHDDSQNIVINTEA
jgi:hypothetical protein